MFATSATMRTPASRTSRADLRDHVAAPSATADFAHDLRDDVFGGRFRDVAVLRMRRILDVTGGEAEAKGMNRLYGVPGSRVSLLDRKERDRGRHHQHTSCTPNPLLYRSTL
jgi:hypothetical protein